MREPAQLLLASLRDDRGEQPVRWDALTNGEIEAFLRLSERHGTLPVSIRNLRNEGVDLHAGAQWDRYLLDQTAAGLEAASVGVQISDALGTDGVVLVPFKGPFLSQLLYGEWGYRRSADIDFLVAPQDARLARTLLERQGFRWWLSASPARETSLLRYSNEYGMRDETGRIVELSWALTPRYLDIRAPVAPMLARSRVIAREQLSFRTLAPEDLLVALVVHGSKHGWARLMWVTDIAELLGSGSGLDLDQVFDEADRAGAGRMLRVALSLAELVVGPCGRPNGRPADVEVAQAILNDVLAGRSSSGASELIWSLRLLDSWPERARAAARLVFTPSVNDWQAVDLPDRFVGLYHLVRPLRLLWKLCVAGGRRIASALGAIAKLPGALQGSR
jgi:hypothetical protein